MKPEEIERKLFDWSLGPLRLLDSVLEKAGKAALAALLRDLLVDWRAYPSRTKYSAQDLRKYAATLGRIAAGLRKAKQADAAAQVAQLRREIEGWL